MTFESFPLLVLHWLVISLMPRLRGINSFRRCSCCQPWHWAPFLHYELLWKLKTAWLGTTAFNPAHTLEVSQCIKYQLCFGAIKEIQCSSTVCPVRDIGPRSLPPHPRQVKCCYVALLWLAQDLSNSGMGMKSNRTAFSDPSSNLRRTRILMKQRHHHIHHRFRRYAHHPLHRHHRYLHHHNVIWMCC